VEAPAHDGHLDRVSIFFLCLVDSVGRKATDHPVLAYHVFIVVLLSGLALRALAARQRRALAA